MTRRAFVKGMAALVGAGMIATLPLPVIDETPITLTDPLAWLWLDDERFALLDMTIDQYREPPVLDPDGNAILPKSTWRWSAEGNFDESDFDRLYAFAATRDVVHMIVQPPQGNVTYWGDVRVSQLSASLPASDAWRMDWAANQRAGLSALLWGVGSLELM